MITGLIILVITGLLWVAIGSVVSRAAHKNLDLAFIQGASAAVIMLITMPVYFFCEINIPVISVAALIVAGAGNNFTFMLMNKAMKYGPNGLTWAMIQSAFVIPFFMGIIFFNVPCSALRATGLILLVISTIGMGIYGRNKQESADLKNKSKWIFFCILAYTAAGFTQCCCNLPSYFIKEDTIDLGNLIFRTGLSCIGIIIMSLIQIIRTKKCDFRNRGTLQQTAILCASSLIATLTLYYAMDTMVQYEAGAISYPVVTGVSIAAFAIYSAINLKEKLNFPSTVCILLTLTGIILAAL